MRAQLQISKLFCWTELDNLHSGSQACVAAPEWILVHEASPGPSSSQSVLTRLFGDIGSTALEIVAIKSDNSPSLGYSSLFWLSSFLATNTIITSAFRLPSYHFKIWHLPRRNPVGFLVEQRTIPLAPANRRDLSSVTNLCAFLSRGQGSLLSRNRLCLSCSVQGWLRTPEPPAAPGGSPAPQKGLGAARRHPPCPGVLLVPQAPSPHQSCVCSFFSVKICGEIKLASCRWWKQSALSAGGRKQFSLTKPALVPAASPLPGAQLDVNDLNVSPLIWAAQRPSKGRDYQE